MFIKIAKYSVKNILRNKFLSVSSFIVLTLLMLFINILWILNSSSNKMISLINSKMSISLYLKDEYTNKNLEVSDLIWDIEKFDKNIKITYKTKTDLIEEIRKKDPNLVKILEKDNPLPETIVLSNISLWDYEELNKIIENKMFVLKTDETDKNHFANYKNQYDNIFKITEFLWILKTWVYAVIFVFFLSIAIIIYSIISNFVYYYKDEIYITKLVWGSNLFIYWPFILQWIFYSIISFIFSLFISFILIQNLNYYFTGFYSFSNSSNLYFIEFLLLIIIWWFSWYFSSKKYLKQMNSWNNIKKIKK